MSFHKSMNAVHLLFSCLVVQVINSCEKKILYSLLFIAKISKIDLMNVKDNQ
jgi:hypothetical protein